MFLPSNARGWLASPLFDETEGYEWKTIRIGALLHFFARSKTNVPSRPEEHSPTGCSLEVATGVPAHRRPKFLQDQEVDPVQGISLVRSEI